MANAAIRGITIEIGGDTKKLGAALNDSEKKSRSLQTELRQIEKLLQFDPTNTDLLIQKQNVLADMIAETSKKLDTMKEAEAQVVAQFEKGEIGEDQLRAFQREIMFTENALDGMKTELRAATDNLEIYGDNNGTAKAETAKLEKEIEEQNKALEAEKRALEKAKNAQKEHEKAVEDAKKTVSDFEDKIDDVAKTIGTGALAIGGAAIAGGGYALSLATDFDKAFNTLVTKTGASAEEMDELNAAMEAVYANNFGDSIEDVAESMATVKTQTGLSGQELQKTTENALLMRDTFGMEVGESVRAVNSLMNQFGISADEAYNLIAQGAQNGLNQNDDLLDTINEYSVQFKDAGYSAEDMFNMLANGVDSGTWSVDKLGDAMKEFNIRASDGTVSEAITNNRKALGLTRKEAKELSKEVKNGNVEAYDTLISKLKEVDDDTKRYQLGVEMFGTMWEDLGEEAVYALFDTQGEISKTSKALDKINNQKYDDIGSALQGLGRTLEVNVIKPLGDELQPVVEDAIDYVQANGPQIKEVLSNIVDAVGSFVGFIVDNSEVILATITGIGTGLLVWNVATMIMGVVDAIKAYKTANEMATISQIIFNAILNANPIILLVTIIAAVVTAIITFIATNDEARTKFLEIWNKIKSACKIAIDAIVKFFTETIPTAWNNFLAWLPGFIDSVVGWFKGLPGKIWTWLSVALSHISSWGSSMWSTASTWVGDMVSKVVEWFKGLPSKIWTWLTVAASHVASWGMSIWSSASSWVSNLVSTVVDWFRGLPGKIWTWLSTAIARVSVWGSQMWTKAKTTATNFVNSVVNFVKTLPSKIWTWLSSVIARVSIWGSNMASRARTVATNFVNNVINFIKSLPAKVWVWLTDVLSRVTTWGTNLVSKAKTAASNLVTTIVDGIKGLPEKVKSVGSDLVTGLWNGISEMASWIYDKISGFGSGVLNKLKSFFGIASPSRLMRDEIGRYVAQGIGVGIEENADSPIGALKDLSKEMAAQDFDFNGATINRKLATTFKADPAQANGNAALLSKLDGIYDRLNRLQIVLDTGVLVGETIEKIDAGLATRQLLSARGV